MANTNLQENLSKIEIVRLIMDFLHRAMFHHAMWFAEVQRQLGKEKAFEILQNVHKTSYDIQIRRLSKILNFEIEQDIPRALLDLPAETLKALKEAIAVNWLANDGVWFQAVEFTHGLLEAKQCNDACWERFSPFEAWSIKRFLQLPENCGLKGLKKALWFRLYACINKQSITEETSDSFILQMNDCRVQNTRRKKGLSDYPCKSAGIVEYSTFASSIDHRIKTQCIGCPPDKPPPQANWFCAWKFYV